MTNPSTTGRTDFIQADAGARHDSGSVAAHDESWWKSTWPLGRADWLQLFGSLMAVIAVFTVAGFTLVDWTAPNAITDYDQELAQSMADGRTDGLKTLAHSGSFLSDTVVKVVATTVLVAIMLYAWRRWHEAVFVTLTLMFEASAYSISAFIVDRPRPDVERLTMSSVDNSFPSGHVAAATVYLALAVVVFWHTRNIWLRALSTVVFAAVALLVAWARLYEGMHFLSDVVAGVILGLISIWIVYTIMGRPRGTYPLLDHSSSRHRSVRT